MKLTSYRLGNSGLRVSKVILGCMSYGSKDWREWVEDDEDKIMEIMKAAYDAGIRTFDTANTYSFGVSETLVRKFIKKYSIPREKLVIISKVYFPTGELNKPMAPDFKTNPLFVNEWGLSRKNIMACVAGSVERLGTYIDVLLIHRYDQDTPDTEIMETLHDVVKSGDVRYIGASAMKAYQFIRLQHTAEKHGWTKFIAMENYHNLLYREEEREMIPYCLESGVGLIPYSPIARGVLARPWGTETQRFTSDKVSKTIGLSKDAAAQMEIVNRVEEIAKERGASMATVATAWSIAKGCNPIVGVSSLKRIGDVVAAVKFKLSEEEVKTLEEPYLPVPPTV